MKYKKDTTRELKKKKKGRNKVMGGLLLMDNQSTPRGMLLMKLRKIKIHKIIEHE